MNKMIAKAILTLFPIILIVLLALGSLAAEQSNEILRPKEINQTIPETSKQYSEQEWGVAFVVRTARIPFDTKDGRITSLVPLMFYDGKKFFLDGMEGGIKLKHWENSRIDFLGRLRFFDIPREYQNLIQEDTVDFGFRYRYGPYDKFFADAEFLTDDELRWHVNFRFEYEFEYKHFDISPFANLRLKSSRFNDYYFGLDRESPGAGMDFSFGLEGRFHVWRNLYLLGKAQSTWFGKDTSDLFYIDSERVDEFYLGVAFMNDKKKQRKRSLSITPYVRLSHGWATPSNLNQIISGDSKKDEYNNQLTSIFYGYPLTDELFGLPLEIYLTPGFLWHWKSKIQVSSQEYVVAIKAYYTFKWPIRWRFGFADGLSYASSIPYVEASEMEKKGYEISNLMNYLDFSLDINMGDLLRYKSLKKVYFGYAIHHRSAIFESAAHFGRISGGSNYHTLYMQYHF